MLSLNNLNFKNHITFKGDITKAKKADGIKTQTKSTAFSQVLQSDTFVKSEALEPKSHSKSDFCDYDEEFEARKKKWLQEKLDILNNAAQKLETQSLGELHDILNTRFSIENDVPYDMEPAYKTLSDTIVSKLNNESIDTKEAAALLYLILDIMSHTSEEANEELSKIITRVSTLLHQAGKEMYQSHFDALQQAFESTGANFSGRVKTIDSIEGKMPFSIVKNIQKGENIFNAASDICAYRLVTDGTEEQCQKIIEKIEELIESGEYTPFLISSHGENPYIPVDKIMELYNEKGYDFAINKCRGFIGTNVILKDKKGKKLELQIIGKEVNKINVKEHKFYKLWAMSPGELEKYFKSSDDIDAYGAYKDACYAYARNLELGIEDKKPELPKGFNEELGLL